MVRTAQGQIALLKVWSSGTDIAIDASKAPKAEFSRLAKAKGWEGGDPNWKSHWEACFAEAYSYGTTSSVMESKANMSDLSMHAEGLDLVSRTRRSSNGSDFSTFSIISTPDSVRSLNSNESLAGGVKVESPEIKVEEPEDEVELARSVANLTLENPPKKKKSKKSKKSSTPPPPTQPTNGPKGSPFWYQFPGFEPQPKSKFKDEFQRLSNHQQWRKDVRRATQIEALNAEIAFHYGTCLQKLGRWQELCEEVGIEDIPTSITKCKLALKPVLVNLFDLIDHRRNPDLPIKRFSNRTQFFKNVRGGNKFPKQCAKKDGFINALLRRI